MRLLYRIPRITLIPCLLLALAATAQQSSVPPADVPQSAPATPPDSTQSAPQTVPATTPAAPAQKPVKKKKQEGKKKEKKNATASGPPTALCNDGTYSHDKPSAGKSGKGTTLCKSNGGVSHYF